MPPVNVFIADDHSITRLGLGILCREALVSCQIKEIASVSELYQNIRTERPDLLILDLVMDEVNCLTAIPELLRMQPDLNILVITMADENTYGNRVIMAGAKGYVNKLNETKTIREAIARVAKGQHYISQEMYLRHLNNMNKNQETRNPFAKLTDKEIEMVHYFSSGMSTSEISEKSRLASSTVSTYKNRIFEKLDIDNIVDLVNLVNTFGTERDRKDAL